MSREAPGRSKSCDELEDLRPSRQKPSRHASSSAKSGSMRPAARRRNPSTASSTANNPNNPLNSPASVSSKGLGGSSHTRSSTRSGRSSTSSGHRPPSSRFELRRSSSGSSDRSRRSLSGSDHGSRRGRSGDSSEHRRTLSTSEHRKTLSTSEHRMTTPLGDGSDGSSSIRKSKSGEDSLLKARERLQNRPRAAPSPRPTSNQHGMSEDLTDELKGSLDGLEELTSPGSAPRTTRPERTLSKAARSSHRARTKRRSDASADMMDDDGASIMSSSSRRSTMSSRSMARGRGGSSKGELTADDDEVSTASRSRKGSRGRRPGGSRHNRSRSRSKSAKRRPVRKPTLPIKEIATVPDEPKKEKEPEADVVVVVSSSSKVRRKPASKSSGLGAGLAFLDDLAPKPKKGSRETRSVGADMMRAPTDSASTGPKRRMKRNKSGGGGSLMAGLSMLDAMNPKKKVSAGSRSVGADMMRSPTRKSDAPVRRLTRTRSQDAAGISDLAAFLHEGSKGAKKIKGSSRSVGAMPTGLQSDQALKKPMRRRMKSKSTTSQSDDEPEDVVLRRGPGLTRSNSIGGGLGLMDDGPKKSKKGQRGKHSASFGSGLDLYAASSSDVESDDASSGPMRGRKPTKGRGSGGQISSLGLDLADVDFSKKGRKPNQMNKYGGSLGSGLDYYTASSDYDEAPSTKMRGRKPNKTATTDDLGDGSLHVSDLLAGNGPRRSMPKKRSSRDKDPEPLVQVEEIDENQDDIFSYYAWSTSRQSRLKILRERKKLTDSIRHGSLMSVYESYVRN